MNTVHLRCKSNNTKNSKNYCGKRLAYKGKKAIEDIKCPCCGGSMMDVTKHVKQDRRAKGLCNCDGLHFSMKREVEACQISE